MESSSIQMCQEIRSSALSPASRVFTMRKKENGALGCQLCAAENRKPTMGFTQKSKRTRVSSDKHSKSWLNTSETVSLKRKSFPSKLGTADCFVTHSQSVWAVLFYLFFFSKLRILLLSVGACHRNRLDGKRNKK